MDKDVTPMRLTEVLQALVDQNGAADRIRLSDILRQMEDRARGLLIILFAIPNCFPGVPGTSAITGFPLVFLTVQMALGRPAWLPRFLSDRTVSRAALVGALAKATPWLKRIERMIYPRLSFLTSDTVERLIGLLGVFLSLTIMLPIPLGNMLPAIALIVFSFGLIGKDGAWILTGLLVTLMAVALLVVAGWTAFQAMIYVWLGWFGA